MDIRDPRAPNEANEAIGVENAAEELFHHY
jgi:hypothetical protein